MRIILLAVIGILLCGLYSCTPEKKLQRLLKQHPELIKTDTVFITTTFTIPVQVHDTIIQLDTSTFGLFDIIDELAGKLDSVERSGLKTEIKNYIINRPILKDTFVVQLRNGGYVKVFQLGKNLGHKLFEPAYTVSVTTPVATPNIVYRDIPWRLPWWWLPIAFVFGFAVGVAFIYKNKNPG